MKGFEMPPPTPEEAAEMLKKTKRLAAILVVVWEVHGRPKTPLEEINQAFALYREIYGPLQSSKEVA